MEITELIQPQQIGWVQYKSGDAPGVMCQGLVTDQQDNMLCAIFVGRQTAMETFKRTLPGKDLRIRNEEHNLSFSVQSADSYQIYPVDLPHGQGTTLLYLLKTSLLSHSPIDIDGLQIFHVWGLGNENKPHFPWWEQRVQDTHRIPFKTSWSPALWNLMKERGWVQHSKSIGFANLWEITVSSEEWQNLIIENLDTLKEVVNEYT